MNHDTWMRLAATELERMLELLESLDADEWSRPTDCPAWDVREVVAHCVGIAELAASKREMARQMRLGRRVAAGRPVIDGANDVQVRERADRTSEQLVADLRDAGARGLRSRSRMSALLRATPVPFGPPLGTRPMGYLVDRILTRDAWMHRIDVSRAAGRDVVLTAEHDGLLVADVVEEWSGSHRLPYDLTLTGPAGGHFSSGSGGDQLQVDAVDFARVLSGRGPGAGLLATAVPF